MTQPSKFHTAVVGLLLVISSPAAFAGIGNLKGTKIKACVETRPQGCSESLRDSDERACDTADNREDLALIQCTERNKSTITPKDCMTVASFTNTFENHDAVLKICFPLLTSKMSGDQCVDMATYIKDDIGYRENAILVCLQKQFETISLKGCKDAFDLGFNDKRIEGNIAAMCKKKFPGKAFPPRR